MLGAGVDAGAGLRSERRHGQLVVDTQRQFSGGVRQTVVRGVLHRQGRHGQDYGCQNEPHTYTHAHA